MQNKSSLTELQAEYACGKMERKILEGLIFQYLLNNFERYRLFNGNRDKWVDFVGWLYPRLSRAVDLYRETGATFDTYISSIVRWSSKEYKAREADHYNIEMTCWKARAEDMELPSMELHSPEPDYDEEDSRLWTAQTKTGILFPLMNLSSRQILILMLKSYYFVTESFLKKVAETIDIKENDLQAMIDKIHTLRSKKEDKIHLCKERAYSQYYRCLTFQKRLLTAMPGTARYEKMENYLERSRIKFKIMKQRLARMRLDASNQQIAEVMNLPKGTVDSVIHGIREKWSITRKQPVMRVPLAGFDNGSYHKECSVTATVSMQAAPQMY
ncbi:MAG: hypothetical protein FWD78_05735 [Treponema sp.]|nr:hypothetical protein [Treponema sp.]